MNDTAMLMFLGLFFAAVVALPVSLRKLAWATVNVYFSACRFLYEKVLGRPPREFSIPRGDATERAPGCFPAMRSGG